MVKSAAGALLDNRKLTVTSIPSPFSAERTTFAGVFSFISNAEEEAGLLFLSNVLR